MINCVWLSLLHVLILINSHNTHINTFDFRALLYADSDSQTQANRKEMLSCWISRYLLSAFGVTDITSLPFKTS